MATKTLYHVTPRRNLGTIRAEGLRPAIGPRAEDAGEVLPAVFFFHCREDLDNALSNWLGEAFEDDPGQLAIIEAQVPVTMKRSVDVTSYEVALTEPVPATCLVAAYSDRWQPIDHFTSPPTMVSAEVHTDHRTLTAHFDASHALGALSGEDLRDLASREFRSCEAADQIAYQECERGNADVAFLLDFCRVTHRTRQPQGFEVSVNEDEMMAWLLHHRPQDYSACLDVLDGIERQHEGEAVA